MEPVILNKHPTDANSALLATLRKDIWLSRAVVESSFRRNKAFQAWNSRVLDKYLKFALREVPTAIYSYPSVDGSVQKEAVTLTTTKHQEAWSYVRPHFEPQDEEMSRLLSPDLDPDGEGRHSSHRAECISTLANLPHLRPNVLYIFGSQSPMSTEAEQIDKLFKTGKGVGGSGGWATGKVQRQVFPNNGHLVPFEQTVQCSRVAVEWISRYLEQYRNDEAFYRTYRSKRSDSSMLVVSQDWKDLVKRSSWTMREKL